MTVEDRAALVGSEVALPLVSLIVVNWNYADYIGATIDSIRQQDYPDLEVVVLDNASTDASREVIERHVEGDGRFTVLHVDENLGQLGGVMHALPHTSGNFVSIIDSDDVLFPEFASFHVQAHLALPANVALTSSNIVEMDAVGRALTGHYETFSQVAPTRARGLRRREAAFRVATVSDEQYHELSRAVRVHESGGGWVWGPGTSNMYRRSVLDLVQEVPPGERWMRAADNYLNPICHLFGGSALIDLPLSAYRVHDANYFCERETLYGVQKGRAEIVSQSLDLHTESCAIFLKKSPSLQPVLAYRFWWAFDQLSAQLRQPTGEFLSTPSVQAIFADHYDALVEALGPDEVRAELGHRLTPRDHYDLLRTVGQLPSSSLDLVAHEGSPTRNVARRAVRIARRYGDVPIKGVPRTLAADARRVAARARRPNQPAPSDPAPAQAGPPLPAPPSAPDDSCEVPSTDVAYGDRLGYGPASLLSVDPPMFLTGMAFKEYVGIAGAFGRRYGDVPAGFLVYPTWTVGSPAAAARVIRRARDHAARYPAHRLVFLCNTAEERDRLVGGGLTAELLNKNFFASESDFFPRDDITVEFDAVYNARFDPNKRHHLASEIGSVAYLTYDDPANTAETRRVQQELIAATLAAHPQHVLLNPTDDGVPVRLPPQGVNAGLNRAAVGLCLSAIEGANYASIEYLLAGLPVVSTPSTGGRDVYFDPEFCVIADPAPDAVRDAVESLRTRNIPPGYIRERTLAKLEPRRRRFLQLIDDLSEGLGGERRHADGTWPFTSMGELVTWQDHWRHLDEFERLTSAAAGRPPEPETTLERLYPARTGIQLEITELRPVVEAILARPGCRLLVFGCGNDSAFWEEVNEGGTTVFLEDDPDWADRVRPTLERSTIHLVEYDTVLDDWRALLHAPDRLVLDLPVEVSGLRFDVIVVDAPPGYRDHVTYAGREAPGRMKSIFTASRLVAPNGVVFVHDAERTIERVYADHYLGADRLCVRAEGHALLLGYQF